MEGLDFSLESPPKAPGVGDLELESPDSELALWTTCWCEAGNPS